MKINPTKRSEHTNKSTPHNVSNPLFLKEKLNLWPLSVKRPKVFVFYPLILSISDFLPLAPIDCLGKVSEDKLFAANFLKAFCCCRYYLPLTDLESKGKSFLSLNFFVLTSCSSFLLISGARCAFRGVCISNQTTAGEKNHINGIKQIFSFRSRKKGCRRGSKEAIFHIFIFLSFIWLAFRYWMPFVMGGMIEKWSRRSLFERFRLMLYHSSW